MKKIILFLLFLIAMLQVSALVDVIVQDIDVETINYDNDNGLIIDCLNCSPYINGDLIKYNIVTDTFSDYSQASNTTTSLFTLSLKNNVYYMDNVFFGSYILYFPGTTQHSEIQSEQPVYYRNTILNKWIQLTFNDSDITNPVFSVFTDGNNFLGYENFDSSTSILNAFAYGANPFGTINTVTLYFNQSIFKFSAFGFNEEPQASIIFNGINTNSETPIITEKNIISINRITRNITISSNNNTEFYKKGVYNWNSNTGYFITNNSITVINNLSNFDASKEEITALSCTAIYGLPNVNFNDIECKSLNDCLIVGNFINESLVFSFNGNSCFYYDLTDDFNTTGTTLNNAEYIPVRDSYFLGGENIFMEMTNDFIFNESETTPQICIDSSKLCLNPIFVSNNFYCELEDYVTCESECINLLVDNTTGLTAAVPYSNCDISFMNSEFIFDIDCGSFTERFLSMFTDNYIGVPICSNEISFDINKNICEDSFNTQEYLITHPNNQIEINGFCASSTCQHECFYEGQNIPIANYTGCISPTTFQRCGQYDSDSCLELGSVQTCQAGTYCDISLCTPFNTTTAEREYPSITIQPDQELYNPNTNTLTLTSTNDYIETIFQIFKDQPTSIYLAKDCEYKETVLLDKSFKIQNITNITMDISGINTIFIGNITNNGTIHFIGGGFEYNITTEYNTTTNIYYNGQLLFQNTGTYSLELNDYSALQITEIKAEFNDGFHTEKFSTLLSRFSGDALTNINIENNISSIKIIRHEESYPPYNLFTNNIQHPQSCTYNHNGCVITRFYASNFLTGWINYKDVNVCFNTVNQGEGSIYELSQGTKILYGLIVLILMIVTGIGLGMAFKMPKLGFITGVVLAIFAMIAMAIPSFPIIGGFVPAWLVVMIFIIAVIISVVVLIKFSNPAN